MKHISGESFLKYAVWHLRDYDYPKLKEAVAQLSDEDMWRRENETSNSVGNLLLHMSGNMRQHIISGAGGNKDVRKRAEEFSASGGKTKAELLEIINATVAEAVAVLQNLDSEVLEEVRVIQDKEEILFQDIFRTIAHFSYHTGQIVYMTKAWKSHRFPWYDYLESKVK